MLKPELLAPAGNREKAILAFKYGADAVYVGGNVFGLRKYADNFQLAQLQQLIDYANKHQKKVYLVLNAFAHNTDIEPIIDYLKACERIAPHAFIISDIGVAQLASQYTTVPIHVSTQASVTHALGCKFWQTLNAKRMILAREVNLAHCKTIIEQTGMELEVFVHGAMCASYSGKCVISNYTAGRDSNRGGCVQSCRHRYNLIDPQTKQVTTSTHIMNAKDLMGIDQLAYSMQVGIASLKIEGRMKSNLYVANAVGVYRRAIDYVYQCLVDNQAIDQSQLDGYKQQLMTVSNRSFSMGGLEQRPQGESINYVFSNYNKSIQYIGMIRDKDAQGRLVCDVKSGFNPADQLRLVSPDCTMTAIEQWTCTDSMANPIDNAKPNTVVRLDTTVKADPFCLLVKDV